MVQIILKRRLLIGGHLNQLILKLLALVVVLKATTTAIAVSETEIPSFIFTVLVMLNMS